MNMTNAENSQMNLTEHSLKTNERTKSTQENVVLPGVQNRRRGRIREQSTGNHSTNTSNENLESGMNVTTKIIQGSFIDKEYDTFIQQISLLQQVNERLILLQATCEQKERRLENIEYKLTKLEIQLQEKFDSLRSDMKDNVRRVQQIYWQSDKIEGSLEKLVFDITSIKQTVDQLGSFHRIPQQSYPVDEDIYSQIQAVTTSMNNIYSGNKVMQEDIKLLQKNISMILNTTSKINLFNKQLLTTDYFTTTLLNARHETLHPVKRSMCINSVNNVNENLPEDCQYIKNQGNNQSGVYRIKPPYASQPFLVYCELNTKGGGWTVIQNRYEGAINFYRGWHDYKYGFGNIDGEFWLGLEKIYLLTDHSVNELLIELEDFGFEYTYAQYSAFAISSETEGYAISLLGTYDGTAGDSLIYHAGMKFSSFDVDHDNWEDGNCAQTHTGGWWYNGCDTSNLNGRYLSGDIPDMYEYQGMYWYDWHGPNYSLMKSRMLIRPRTDTYSTVTATKVKSPKGEKIKQTDKQTAISDKVMEKQKIKEDNPLSGQVTETDNLKKGFTK